MTEPIAVVGLGGVFPGAPTLGDLWPLLASGTDASREVPPGRWTLDPERAFDPEPGGADHVYSTRGCFVDGFDAEPGDPDPSLGILVRAGQDAWRSACTDRLDLSRVGVVIGNIVLPTDGASAISQWTVGRRFAAARVPDASAPPSVWHRYVAGRPAGVLAQALGLRGEHFALDAACASSLYALELAARELRSGRADAMLTGGLSRPDCLYTQMGFSQLRALSRQGRCRPFDHRGDGLIVGEGAGILVLKRLSDARRHGDKIWGVIRGVGLSNDVDGNLLAPSCEGQLRAMRAAYAQAGWAPTDVGYVECHATGTPIGDAVEFESLRRLWGDAKGRCPLGAVKANVGHLLTAAGAVSLIKVLLAMDRGEVPPVANFEHAAAKIDLDGAPFAIPTSVEPWGGRRAAVSGFGFGGTNAHVLLESISGAARERSRVAVPPEPDVPVAIVGLAAHVGPWRDLAAMRERLLGHDETPPRPKTNFCGLDDAPVGHFIDEVEVPLGRFRIPPTELQELLPQQLLALEVADQALDDVEDRDSLTASSVGTFVGLALDLGTTDYHLRWIVRANAETWGDQVDAACEALGPALDPNRVLGGLGSVTASRIAREFGIGGPSFAISSEDTSGLSALLTAARFVADGSLDAALVAGVELGADARAMLPELALRGEPPNVPSEGAAALVLKRLPDAQRDGDRIYAVLRGGEAKTTSEPGRRPEAACGLLPVVGACLRLHHRYDAGPWLRDRADGPRRVKTGGTSITGASIEFELEEAAAWEPGREYVPPAHEALFVVEGDIEALLDGLARLASVAGDTTRSVADLARGWHGERGRDHEAPHAVAIVADSPQSLARSASDAASALRAGNDPQSPGRVFFARAPVRGEVAFVFPGSGSHGPQMGRELASHFPEAVWKQDAASERMRSQLRPDLAWESTREAMDADPHGLILAQVSWGTLGSDIVRSFGIEPDAVIGYSLGETAGLFALGAWTDRDEMLRRATESDLFTHELAGPCRAAARAWRLPDVDWAMGVVEAPAPAVDAELGEHAYRLIVNTPRACVIGGQRSEVQRVVAALDVPFHPLHGVTTVHCPVVREVEDAYRELHRLPTHAPVGVRFYSGAWGEAYEVDTERAAASITDQALHGIDFPRVIRRAYDDGVRVFIEIGPGSSCTRMIEEILGDRPALARSLDAAPGLSGLLRCLGAAVAHRIPVDLGPLLRVPPPSPERGGPSLRVPVGRGPAQPPRTEPPSVAPAPASAAITRPLGQLDAEPPLARAAMATARAHEAYLRLARQITSFAAATLQQPAAPIREQPPVALDREHCLEFAAGSIGNVLGPRFAEADAFPTRVRLPAEPLMLVDRVVEIDAEPLSMTGGRLVTEHDVREGSWYLDSGRIPTCIAVEAGQADLLLSAYLGIDLQTRGEAMYRLLDATVEFHDGLPRAGKTIRYEIEIERFFRQADTWLFRFHFDASVDGKPLMSMRDGCAGFFTPKQLAEGKGIVGAPALEAPGGAGAPLALGEQQLDALRAGDLFAAFGSASVHRFGGEAIDQPLTLPGGKMRLVHRVTDLDPEGGTYGRGFVRAEADINPDDWFITCHFIDDQVMPGTLMYECCLHSLRVFLLRMGWIGRDQEACFEPIVGVQSRLKCRGQVLATTKMVTYEVSIRELGAGPEPYAIADAAMYADGKRIVDIGDMAVRLTGATAPRRDSGVVFGHEQLVEFTTGRPSLAFGEPYEVFDDARQIARLPRAPFLFIDRVTRADAEPFVLKAGAKAVAEVDHETLSWICTANRQPDLPLSVLVEVALQPCGWLAAYCGSALQSDTDVRFRNLGGDAVLHRAVDPSLGPLRTSVEMTNVSKSAGMIIQNFTFEVADRRGPVYSGKTYFGFFSAGALADQVGLRDAKLLSISEPGDAFELPDAAPLPDPRMRMVDRIVLREHSVEGSIAVDPSAWFFEAHFYQDPVWPGSLGLEAFVQLLKAFAVRRWNLGPDARFSTVPAQCRHEWIYRGQVTPSCKTVTVQATVTRVDGHRIFADGYLCADGRPIYEMRDFALEVLA